MKGRVLTAALFVSSNSPEYCIEVKVFENGAWVGKGYIHKNLSNNPDK